MVWHEARHGEAEARLDHADFADDARLDEFHQFERLRVQPVHEGFAEKSAGLARCVDHRVGFECGKRKRLLAKHVLPSFRRLDRPFGMAWMRRRNVDRVHVRIAQQRVIAVEDAGARKAVGEAGLARIARANGRKDARLATGRARRRRISRYCRVRGFPSGFSWTMRSFQFSWSRLGNLGWVSESWRHCRRRGANGRPGWTP